MKQRIFCDMDNVLCDFKKAVTNNFRPATPTEEKYPQSKPGFFILMEPLPNAIESMTKLQENHDVWILTRPSFFNLHCYTEKAIWVRNHLGYEMQKKLILCGDKSLLKGDFLIDDDIGAGQEDFEGQLIRFGKYPYSDWLSVMGYGIFK